MKKSKNVSFKTLNTFVTKVFEGYGVPKKDAVICARVLLESDRRGIESHGVNRFKPIYLDRIKTGILNPVTNFEIVRETKTTAVVDGHDGMGMVIGQRAMAMAIKKAKRYGMGMVAVRNSSHYGIAGYYTSMACEAGCIGITGTNARPSIAPTFGVSNMLGTNPLTFGMPTDEDFDFVLDCATSITQRGRIEYYAKIGEPVPAGQIITRDGNPSTDAGVILDDLTKGISALAPLGGAGEDMGGYKGYGYATVVEILSASLSQANYLQMLTGVSKDGKKEPISLGHFFMAINCEAFLGLESFKKTTGDILRALRASDKAVGQDRIYTAGEKEYYISLERAISGVPINEAVQKEFLALRDELGLKVGLPFK
ncbi:MAG: Ldh family oxidoreductase [Firmicutes bacterium]|nr:Ldh family oxidoreductase [Bacillota bacterium]